MLPHDDPEVCDQEGLLLRLQEEEANLSALLHVLITERRYFKAGADCPHQRLFRNVAVNHVTEGRACLQQPDTILRLLGDTFHPLNRCPLIRQA